MNQYLRIIYLLVCAVISALVVPEAICHEDGWGLWAGGSCSDVEELAYRALFMVLSWLCVLLCVMIWREDW